MSSITPPNGDQRQKGNRWLEILIVLGVPLAFYFSIYTPECRDQFIYLTAVIVQTWYKTEKSEKSEDSEVSDPLEKLEQSDEEQSDEEQSDEEKSDESDNSEEQSDEEQSDEEKSDKSDNSEEQSNEEELDDAADNPKS